MSRSLPTISKSRFQAGRQCAKRLYSEVHTPELLEPSDPADAAIAETGLRLGLMARTRFPGGVLIEDDPANPEYNAEAAAERTAEALADPTVPAIFEAAIRVPGLSCRVDCLVRNEDASFDLVEVKSAATIQTKQRDDVAFQLHVCRLAGLQIRDVRVLHLDDTFTLPEDGTVDPGALFRETRLTEDADALAASVREQVEIQRTILAAEKAPEREVGSHCKADGVKCPLYTQCHQLLPDHHISEIPYASKKLKAALQEAGIRSILDIPPTETWVDVDPAAEPVLGPNDVAIPPVLPVKPKKSKAYLTENQQRIWFATRTGRPYWNAEGIADAFRNVVFPLQFLDFETILPAIPLLPGTRPYQTVTVQWSLHAMNRDGQVSSRHFLPDGPGDPERRLLEALLTATEGDSTILVYTDYEQQRLEQLATRFPEYRAAIEHRIARFLDLHDVIKRNTYLPAYRGKTSIKSVLPALVPGLSYEDLAIQNGAMAAQALLQLLDPATDPADRAVLREQLLAYCHRDTLAMVELTKRVAPFLLPVRAQTDLFAAPGEDDRRERAVGAVLAAAAAADAATAPAPEPPAPEPPTPARRPGR